MDSAAQFLGQLDIRCEVAPGTVYRYACALCQVGPDVLPGSKQLASPDGDLVQPMFFVILYRSPTDIDS